MRNKLDSARLESECHPSALPPPTGGEFRLSGVIDAIMDISRKRAALLNLMRGALKAGDNGQVVNLARQLCGVANEEGSRTHPRIN
jgi:hypothetical protein